MTHPLVLNGLKYSGKVAAAVIVMFAILMLVWMALSRVGQAATEAADHAADEAVESIENVVQIPAQAVGALAVEAADSAQALAGINERRVMPIRLTELSGEALESSGALGIASRDYTADVQAKITTSGLGRTNDELLCFEGVPFTVFAVQGVEELQSSYDESSSTSTIQLPAPELLDYQGAFVSGSYEDCHEVGFVNNIARALPGVSDTDAGILRDQMHVAFQEVAAGDDELLLAASCAGAELLVQILDEAYAQQGLSIRLRVEVEDIDLSQCSDIDVQAQVFDEEALTDLNGLVAEQLTSNTLVLPGRHESLDLSD